MLDLHLHSTASDGDLTPAQVVEVLAGKSLTGISLTDHNGIWGVDEARAAAEAAGLMFVEGIEVSTLAEESDVHILGYSWRFDHAVLEEGLASTRAGYADRIREMVQRCQEAGFSKIQWEAIEEMRRGWKNPSYVSYDVARQLTLQHDVPIGEARRLTVEGGSCYVPLGAWALSPAAAIELLHAAGGKAVLAHPGILIKERGEEALKRVVEICVKAGLDGVEVYHPFHDQPTMEYFRQFCEQNHLKATGGSDWHGEGRHAKNDEMLGKIGVKDEYVEALLGKSG